MAQPRVVVTFSPPPDVRAAFAEVLDPVATMSELPDVDDRERSGALEAADAVLAWDIDSELRGPEELRQLKPGALVQLLSAGADHVPFDEIPESVAVAANAGAYAEPIAEHVLAMALALAKRLPQNHMALARGEFDHDTRTRVIRGSLVGVLGFGGIGQASAELFQAIGARVHAINRSGRADAPVDRISTLDDLDEVLAAADVVVVSLPLTRATRGLIGARELSLMKSDAILVNVARAAIVDEDALFDHLRTHASFSAGIDTWWQEPGPEDAFATRRPFLELPNVIGSPHNSAITEGTLAGAGHRAAANAARFLRGERPEHVVERADYLG